MRTTTPTETQPPLSLRSECLTGGVLGLGLDLVPEPPADGVEPTPLVVPLEGAGDFVVRDLVPEPPADGVEPTPLVVPLEGAGDFVLRDLVPELLRDVSLVCFVSTTGEVYAGFSAKQTGQLVKLSSSGT